jgi:hypothetical protein
VHTKDSCAVCQKKLRRSSLPLMGSCRAQQREHSPSSSLYWGPCRTPKGGSFTSLPNSRHPTSPGKKPREQTEEETQGPALASSLLRNAHKGRNKLCLYLDIVFLNWLVPRPPLHKQGNIKLARVRALQSSALVPHDKGGSAAHRACRSMTTDAGSSEETHGSLQRRVL